VDCGLLWQCSGSGPAPFRPIETIRRPALLPPVPLSSLSNRRPLFWFLLGALTMAVLTLVLFYVAPRWLPAGGVTIHVGPNPGRAVRGARPAAIPPAGTPDAPPPAAPPAAAPVVPADTPPAVGPVAAQQPLEPSGRLLVPVQGVRPEQLADTYNAARSQGRRHDAIDIMARRGTPVLATASGVVLKLFQSVRGGTALYELAPDQHTIYYYAHLDRYAPGMVEGRALRQGDLIGYVGDTGNAGAGNYHLHFEISTTTDPKRYWAGTPQNPYPLLRAGVSRP
jgi:peptidoglycan LD-endopeptidase LytH